MRPDDNPEVGPWTFDPDWSSPPGDTMLDLLDERGWTLVEAAERLGVSVNETRALAAGALAISQELAERLAIVVGSTTEFWRTREAHYRRAQASLMRHAEMSRNE